MLRDFKTAIVVPLRLQPFIQDVLNSAGYKPSLAVRDILSKIEAVNPDNADDIIERVLKVYEEVKIIEEFGQSFFAYRQGDIPQSIFYMILHGHRIAMDPHLYPNLPDDYVELQRDVEIYAVETEQINDPYRGSKAKFCYGMGMYFRLYDFLRDVRTGKQPLSDPQTLENHNALIGTAHRLIRDTDKLGIGIRNLIKKINFIFNHHDNDFCDFISIGIENSDLGPNDVFEILPARFTENSRKIFDICYAAFAEKYSEENHDLFYAFSEQVITPAMQLYLARPTTSPLCFDYMMAHATIGSLPDNTDLLSQFGLDIAKLYYASLADNDCSEVFIEYGITKQNLRDMSACLSISDLAYTLMKLEGPRTCSVYDEQGTIDLYDKLQCAGQLEIDNLHLNMMWRTYCTMTADYMEAVATTYPETIEEYGLHPG